MLLLVSPVVGILNVPEESGRAAVENLSYDNFSVEEDGAYATIALEGCTYMHREGFPMLPYYTKTYTFPAGTKIQDVTVIPQGVTHLTLSRKIAPAPPAVPLNMQPVSVEVKEGPVYHQNEFYPQEWYTLRTGMGISNGERVVFVTVHLYPVRYNAVKNEAVYAHDFDVELNYRLPTRPLFTGDAYDLIIIAPDGWKDALAPLQQHKESHGIRTLVVGLSEIYGGTYFSVQGRDDAEKVKYFIKDAIEQWGITYVMLVGGRNGGLFNQKWWVPVRYAHLDDRSGWEKSFLSDLYFSDVYKYEDGQPVFDDWDSNGNDVFAEWSGFKRDTLDLFPDVYIGRLACRNKWEVNTMVDKIITYETTAHGADWFKRMVVVGGDSAPYEDDPYYEGEEENKAALGYMEGFEPVRIWTSLGTLTGPEDVIAAVNEGCGFLFFDGHGNPMNWATHPPHDEGTWIDGLGVRDMSQLSNDGMYPVCVVGGCHNAQFNVSVLNLLKIWEGSRWYDYLYRGETAYECWAWRLASKSGGGSIATLGYTGLDWFGAGDDGDGIPDCIQYLSGFMNVHFFEEYGVHGTDMLGAVHANTITKYIQTLKPYTEFLDAKTVEEFVLLGDPSLKIGGYGTS